MVAELLATIRSMRACSEDPLPLEETPEYAAFQSLPRVKPSGRERFRAEFDRELAGRVSRLVDWKCQQRGGPGCGRARDPRRAARALSDDDAIRMVLDPSRNRVLGEPLTLTTHDKLSRAMFIPTTRFARSSPTRPTVRTSVTA